MLRFASLPPSLAQASLKGYLSNVSIPSRETPSYIYKRRTTWNRGGTRSRGVICSASTNRPDCQRSRCRHNDIGPKNSEEPRPCPLLRHPEYYRSIRTRSRTFSEIHSTFCEPPLPVSKTRAGTATTQPPPQIPLANHTQTPTHHKTNTVLRNGFPGPCDS